MAKRRRKTNKNVPAKGRLREMAEELWALAVRDDWGNCCAFCGARGRLHSHHLIPRGGHEAVKFEMMNGICLCARCHVYDSKISPHLNAAAWIRWLVERFPRRFQWVQEHLHDEFRGIKNADYYCQTIRNLKQYVPDNEFTRIVGQKFAAWLDEQE